MDSARAMIKLTLLLFLAASPDYSAKAQDAETVEEEIIDLVEDVEEMVNALAVDEMVQIPALSYTNDEGMMAIPTVNLSNPMSVLALQELIGNQTCDCTSSGYSGISLSDDGTLVTYGNTTIVGCAAHDMLQKEGVEADVAGCYVVGGTGCNEATASVLGSENEAFTMAAWRDCSPLTSKNFGFCGMCGGGGMMSNYYRENINIETTSYQQYQPPMCGQCGFKPMVPMNTNYCSGSSASASASSGFGGAASASASSGGCGGAASASASSG